jgi:hypothetical protein
MSTCEQKEYEGGGLWTAMNNYIKKASFYLLFLIYIYCDRCRNEYFSYFTSLHNKKFIIFTVLRLSEVLHLHRW